MTKIDIDDLARRMGGQPKGEIKAGSGYFGARQLAAQVRDRFRTPTAGEHASTPELAELRDFRLRPGTLERLEELARELSAKGWQVAPPQLAALLLEMATEQLVGTTELERRLHHQAEPRAD